MERNIPTRVQFTKFNKLGRAQSHKLNQNEAKWIVKMDGSKSKSLKMIRNLPKWGKIVQSLPKWHENSYMKCTRMNVNG